MSIPKYDGDFKKALLPFTKMVNPNPSCQRNMGFPYPLSLDGLSSTQK